jgi:hypothetical protein
VRNGTARTGFVLPEAVALLISFCPAIQKSTSTCRKIAYGRALEVTSPAHGAREERGRGCR